VEPQSIGKKGETKRAPFFRWAEKKVWGYVWRLGGRRCSHTERKDRLCVVRNSCRTEGLSKSVIGLSKLGGDSREPRDGGGEKKKFYPYALSGKFPAMEENSPLCTIKGDLFGADSYGTTLSQRGVLPTPAREEGGGRKLLFVLRFDARKSFRRIN